MKWSKVKPIDYYGQVDAIDGKDLRKGIKMRKQMCCRGCYADTIKKRPCDTCIRNTVSKGNPVNPRFKDNFITKEDAIHSKAEFRGLGLAGIDDGRWHGGQVKPSYTKREKRKLNI